MRLSNEKKAKQQGARMYGSSSMHKSGCTIVSVRIGLKLILTWKG